jgi:hypothetical protein
MADEARAFREMPDAAYADVMNGRTTADEAVRSQMSASAITIYAAVIEWPGVLADRAPGLVLARTTDERDEKIGAEIRATADAMSDSEWRDAIAQTDSDHWADWLEPLEQTTYDSPIVTDYIEEVAP